MFLPRIIPVLLLKGKGLVKTVKFKEPKYIGDPINAVKIFNDLKADELVFLDITASKEGRTVSVDLVKEILKKTKVLRKETFNCFRRDIFNRSEFRNNP